MRLLTALATLAVSSFAPRVWGAALDCRDSSDFVSTSGQTFTLNGGDFFVAGTNAYWLAQQPDEDVDTALTDIANAGLTVVRTW